MRGACTGRSAALPPETDVRVAPSRCRHHARAAEELFLHLGASIGYWRGDITGLMEDIGARGGARELLLPACEVSRCAARPPCLQPP